MLKKLIFLCFIIWEVCKVYKMSYHVKSCIESSHSQPTFPTAYLDGAGIVTMCVYENKSLSLEVFLI